MAIREFDGYLDATTVREFTGELDATDEFVSQNEASVGSGFSVGNIASGIGNRVADLAGNVAGFTATAGANLEKDAKLGGLVWENGSLLPSYKNAEEYAAIEAADPGGSAPRRAQRALTAVDFGYKPGTTWEEVKAADGFIPVAKKLATFGLETGLVSAPDMAAAVVNAPVYFTSRTEEIAQDRAKNDGRAAPDENDVAIGASTAAIVSAMEKFGAERVFNAFIKGGTAPSKILKAAVGEGGTEFVQEQIEYAGESAGTKAGWAPEQSLERGVQGLVGGVTTGGTLGGVGAVISREGKPRPADPIDAAIEDANAIVDSAQTEPMVDQFADQLAQQNAARQAEIDAAMPDAGPTIQMRPSARNEVYPTGPVRVPWLDTTATAEKPATINERGEFEFAPTKPAATSPEAPFAYEGAVDFKAPDLTTEPGAAPEATANQAEPGIPYAPNLSVETSRDASRRIARDERIQEQQKALGDVALPDGLKDPRLKRLDYRKALGDMSRQLVKGGDVTYVRDENDRITGRTGSINPDWFKALGEDKSTAMPVEDVKKAVNKALMGGKLGVREQRVISAMLNAHSGLRTSGPNIDYAKAQLDAAREGRRQSTGIFTPDAGEILLEDEYASDWSAEARILQELILEAEAVNPGTTYSIVERMAINGASTQEIMEALDQIITGEGNAKEAEQRSAVGAQEAPGGQEGGPRTAQTFGDGRGVPGPQSANPDEGARAEVGEVDRIPPAPRGEPGAPGAPVDAQGANDLSDRRQAAEPVAVAADQRQGERRSSGKARALYEQMSKDELIRALLHHELTGIKGKRSFVVEVEDAENVISIDADSLKWVNDNMSPDSGDRLLHATADALVEEFGYERAYHTSGDEFYVLLSPGESLDEAKAAMDRVEARVKATVIELTLKDGTYKSVTGITATPGYGTTKNEADYDLKVRKTEREASGQRAARGERPAGAVVRPAPGGMQGDEGNTAPDAAPDVRREVSPEVTAKPSPADARKAAAILDAANVRGDSYINAIDKFRNGTLTLKDLEEAYPPKPPERVAQAPEVSEQAPEVYEPKVEPEASTPSLDYVRVSDVVTPAQGSLYSARKGKEAAWKQVKRLRQRLKDEPLGGNRQGIRLELLKAEESHREYQRAERGALSAIERRANELGQTTIKEKARINAARANPRQQIAEEMVYRGSKPTAGMQAEAVREAIAPIVLTWGDNAPGVEVVATQAGLPAHIQRQIGEGGSVQGVHDSATGTVYLIADSLANKADANRILAHEAVGHYGLEEAMGDTYQKAVDRVKWMKRMGNKKVRALADRVVEAYPGADPDTEAREILAMMAEGRQFGSVLGDLATKAYAAVRAFLRKLGFRIPFSNSDIDAMLARSAAYLRESGGKRKTVTEALEHPQLGEIDVALGKGRMGASKFATENPEVAANLEDLVAGAKLVEETATRATLQNGDATFDLVKKAGRWVLTDARVDFARSPFTETEAFKRWFGDSKVVDADGKPLVVYHGTPNASFETFRPESYFSQTGEIASIYTSTSASSIASSEKTGDAPAVYPVYLKIERPFDTRIPSIRRVFEKEFFMKYGTGTPLQESGLPDWNDARDLAEWIQEEGKPYDGLILDEGGLPQDDGSIKSRGVSFVPLSPYQVKSATGNRGTFDPSDARINFARSRTVGASNRTYTADQQAAFEKTGRTVSEPTWKERVAEMTDGWSMKLRQGIADQFAPIADLDPKAYILSRLSKASDGALEAFMLHGQLKLKDGVYDADMRGGVIDKLLKPLQGEMDDFMWWVAANRAERLMGEGKERLFTEEDIAAYKSLASGQASFDYTLQHNTGPHKAGTKTRDRSLIYRDAAKTLEDLNKNVMDMAEQSGLIDADNRKAWEQEFYIPFYRAMEDGIGGPNIKSGLVRQYAFKKLKGGKEKLNADLLANTIQNWAHLLSASAKNRAAEATLKAAEKIGAATPLPYGAPKPKKGTVQFLGYSERAIPKGQKYTESGIEKVSDGTVTIREHGEIHYAVDDPFLLDAVTALEFNGFGGPVMKVAGKFKHYLTVGVTANPTFKVRNLIRDSISAIGVSNDLEANPLKNLKQGFKATSKESQTYVSMLASGGIIKFGTMLEGNRTDHVRSLVDKGVDASTILDSEHKVKAFWRRYIKPAVDAYNDLGDRGESINRAALYEQMIANGMSHAEASLAARDLLDFSMGGTWTAVRLLTQVLPFANARVQGLYKLGRSDKKRLGYVVGSVSLASLALLAAYGDDDDWKQREDWDRDSYWWFKFGGVAFRIPKPFEIGAIGTLAERSAELFFDNEMTGKRYMERVGHLVGDQLAMNPIPQVVKPILDVYSNKDSFTGRPIETMGMDRLMPEDRYTGKTSEIAKVIGQVGLLSPVQADHLIRGYFGWLGTATTTGVDLLARSTVVDEPPRPAMKLRDVFLAGNFVETLPANGSRYVSQMYDQAKEIEQAWASFQHYRKLGDMDRAREILEENRDKISKFKRVSKIKEIEANINRRIRQIESSRTMDSEVKRDLLDKLYRQRDAVARKVTNN